MLQSCDYEHLLTAQGQNVLAVVGNLRAAYTLEVQPCPTMVKNEFVLPVRAALASTVAHPHFLNAASPLSLRT